MLTIENQKSLIGVSQKVSHVVCQGGLNPSYDDIFRPPKKCFRESGKLYGKELLEKGNFRAQHALLLDNYRTVREWLLEEIHIPSDLRHKKEEQDAIKKMIGDKYTDIKKMEFSHATYHWKVEDIYKWMISSKQSSRKYDKVIL